ncbi:protein odr-4 homolog [Ornithodoros turicata]|uniref:Putative olfactory receptor 4-like protein n=1 Tax=Ornithodoros turicata TaxID=34597 RepID=A0A2R5LBA6_9ACAR
MGRTVVYDDHVQKSLNGFIKTAGKDLMVGVIIGQCAQQRDIVIHVASSPKKADGDHKEGDGKRKIPSPCIDESWMCQHARQVTRMLPGGLDILGLFAVAPGDVLTAAQPKLREALYAVFKSIGKDEKQLFNAQVTDKILLQVCSVSHKVVCKTFDVRDHLSGAKPAEWKVGGAVRWHRLEATMSLSLWAAQSQERCNQSLLKQLQSTLEPFFHAVDSATPLLNGEARAPEESLDPSDRRKAPQSIFVVDLFLPMDSVNNNQVKSPTPTLCSATMSVVGTIQCRGFVHSKATVKEAIRAIKQDIVRSITSRCEIQCEDMLLIEDEQHDPSVMHELPKRVFAPLDGVTLCDYIFHGDGAQDSLEAFNELLGLVVDPQDIELDVEHSPESNQQVIEGAEAAEIINEATEQLSRGRNLLIPIASAAIAALGAGISYLLLQE